MGRGKGAMTLGRPEHDCPRPIPGDKRPPKRTAAHECQPYLIVFTGAEGRKARAKEETRIMRIETAFLFDLDGTLVDSVYQHVLAWKPALDAEAIELSVWRIHRKIGMSGGLFTNQLLRETGFD